MKNSFAHYSLITSKLGTVAASLVDGMAVNYVNKGCVLVKAGLRIMHARKWQTIFAYARLRKVEVHEFLI